MVVALADVTVGTTYQIPVPDSSDAVTAADIQTALTSMHVGNGVVNGLEYHLNNLNSIKLNKAGGSVTGKLTYSAGITPTTSNDIPNKGYVDAQAATATSSAVADASSYTNSQITTLETTLKAVIDLVLPIGSIIMWSGHGGSIGSGNWANWRLCSGGTVNGIVIPDLRDKFIKASNNATPGASAGQVGNSGGTYSLTIPPGALPGHTHSFTTGSAGSHSHTAGDAGSHSHRIELFDAQRSSGSWSTPIPATAGGPLGGRTETAPNHSHSISTAPNHTHSGTTNSTGSGNAFLLPDPPYYTLAFIIRVV